MVGDDEQWFVLWDKLGVKCVVVPEKDVKEGPAEEFDEAVEARDLSGHGRPYCVSFHWQEGYKDAAAWDPREVMLVAKLVKGFA